MKLALVIEENLEVRENTAEILELGGYKVILAENGKEGFEMVLKFNPDIIICDLIMSKTNGKSFLKLMKGNESTSNIPVIFFSAGVPDNYILQHFSEHYHDYLTKPFTKEELILKINKLHYKK